MFDELKKRLTLLTDNARKSSPRSCLAPQAGDGSSRNSKSAISSEPPSTESQRDIGLRLLNDIMTSCPDQYVLMMRENNERRSASERTGDQDGNGRDQGSDPDPNA